MTAVLKLSDISLHCRNFKCFGDEWQGFDKIKPINILIGRNSSGKSSLLDMLQLFVSGLEETHTLSHRGSSPELRFGFQLSQELAEQVVSNNTEKAERGAFSIEFSPRAEAISLLEKGGSAAAFTSIDPRNRAHRQTDLFVDPCPGWRDLFQGPLQSGLAKVTPPINQMRISRLSADRDVRNEPASSKIDLGMRGEGLTNTLRRLVHAVGQDRDLVEISLLGALNFILKPDTDFKRILIEEDESTSEWVIQLEEHPKGRIPITQMGSGFKTVLLVLANLLIIPEIPDKRKRPLPEYVFAFEELENNLHPSAQRRLFNYIRFFASSEGCTFFITTHSNVVIDMFAGDDLAQILHVEHDGTRSKVTVVDDHISQGRVLDDLDVRASDLLQANSIVWVEGPSDRIYFNAWMRLFDRDLIEGVHYQCLTYAGSLNKHFSFEFEPELVDELIGALKVNRNAILIADSDRRKPEDQLKLHTARLESEVNKTGLAWVTAGREVENYIPLEVIRKICKQEGLSGPKSRFGDAIAYLKKKLSRTTLKKPDLAEKVVPHLTLENVQSTLDLGERMSEVVAKIRKWNHMDRT